jgi:exopolyphosphatase/guanosine-5'-triphosphate,3'-diphosphate pyrophosphatase
MGIYEKENNQIKEIFRERHQVRLAEGLNSDNMLKKEPMERTLKVFEKYRQILMENDVDDFKAIATESLRRAENASQFIQCVKLFTGIEIDVLEGKQEAYFGALAAGTSVRSEDFYVIDIGGGSVEISKVKEGKVENYSSAPLGCVVMTEQFSPDENGDKDIKSYMYDCISKNSWINEKLPICVLGGVVKELAVTVLGEKDFDGKKITSQQVFDMYNRIYNTKICERAEKFGIDPKRCDVMVAGLCPLLTLIEIRKADEIGFCSQGVREGVAMEFLNEI